MVAADSASIRRWAKRRGISVSSRGRIPAWIKAEYQKWVDAGRPRREAPVTPPGRVQKVDAAVDEDWKQRMKPKAKVVVVPRGKKARIIKTRKGRTVVVNKPDIKPASKPRCREHKEEMVFNQIRQVWECPQRPACPQIARPRQSNEGNAIVMGKGKVELRLFYLEEGGNKFQRVVLITDDNIAIDVTDYINLETLVRVFDAESVMKEAADQGKSMARVSVQKAVPLVVPLSIFWNQDK